MKNNNQSKAFAKIESRSTSALNQFESTIEKLRIDNEELAYLHQDIDKEIERLSELKESISVRVAANQVAINGLVRVVSGE